MKEMTEKLESELKLIMSSGGDIEQILKILRQKEFSQIDSIKAIKALYKLDFGDAKYRVHFSETWKDKQDSNNKLHDDAESALRQSLE